MDSFEEKKNAFLKKLERQQDEQQQKSRRDLDALNPPFSGQTRPPLDDPAPVRNVHQTMVSGQIQMTSTPVLEDLDQKFIQAFQIGTYYSTDRSVYPTVYCETLEEFFMHFVVDMNYSEKERQSILDLYVRNAQEEAARGGRMKGVNFPGQGCYINGWIFAYGRDNLTPGQALKSKDIFPDILETIAHEKLGHGFLDLYSTLGQTNVRLGLTKLEIARHFGLQPAEDPLASLRYEQHDQVFRVSHFLEEGWASWLGHYMQELSFGHLKQPRRTWEEVKHVFEALPEVGLEGKPLRKEFLKNIDILFGEGQVSDLGLNAAMRYFEDIDPNLDEKLSHILGQTLRYVIGELLFDRLAQGVGLLCVPYAALIAAYVDFKLDQISLSDLRELLKNNPRLSPDTRLATISRCLKLRKPGSVGELVKRVQDEFSFSVPDELKKAVY